MNRKKALILAYSNLNKDPRPLRQIDILKNSFDITTVGYGSSNVEGVSFINIDFPVTNPRIHKLKKFGQLLFRNFEGYYWDQRRTKLVEELKKYSFDLIIANDIDTLPIALKLKDKNTKVYFDAHEYHPREFEDELYWRVLFQSYKTYLCRKYMQQADLMSTVGGKIAEEYKKNFNVDSVVITNASGYQKIEPIINNDSKNIRIIHHGVSMPARKIEVMIEMMKYTDEKFHLDLMLVPTNKKYFESLVKHAEQTPRVKMIEPVSFDKIVGTLSQYDVGLYILAPTNFNNFNALPNKIFEFVQARLALAISPSPEMAQVVNKYQLGVVAKDFTAQAMAQCINNLDSEKIKFFKAQSDKNAYELSSEKNKEKLTQEISSIMNLNN